MKLTIDDKVKEAVYDYCYLTDAIPPSSEKEFNEMINRMKRMGISVRPSNENIGD